MIRPLTPIDLPDFDKLLRARSRIGKSDLDEALMVSAVHRAGEGMKYPDYYTMWGRFDGGELVSVMSQQFSDAFPTDWNMSFMMLDPNIDTAWNYSKNGFDDMWAAAIDAATQKGRTRINWSLPSKWENSQGRTQKTSRVWPAYDITLRLKIVAGDSTTDPFDQWIFGTRPKSYDVTLKQATPK